MSYTEHMALELRRLAESPEALTMAHAAIEDVLIEWRADRLSIPLVGNGLVIRERDGTPSSIIRMRIPEALVIGLRAMADYIEANP